MELFDHLLDQIIEDPEVVRPLLAEFDSAGFGPLLNSLVVDDRKLARVDRGCDQPIAVTVLNSTGAGGITSLAGRSFTHLRPTAVQTGLRDPGDLVGNVARVATAARELDPDITVLVDIPDGFGWQDAVAEAEASGLTGIVRAGAPDQVASRLGAFVEADLPFAVDGVGSAAELITLLIAVDAVIDGAEETVAAELISAADHDQAAIVRGWDDNRIARVRRRIRTARVIDAPGVKRELAELGLTGPAT